MQRIDVESIALYANKEVHLLIVYQICLILYIVFIFVFYQAPSRGQQVLPSHYFFFLSFFFLYSASALFISFVWSLSIQSDYLLTLMWSEIQRTDLIHTRARILETKITLVYRAILFSRTRASEVRHNAELMKHSIGFKTMYFCRERF